MIKKLKVGLLVTVLSLTFGLGSHAFALSDLNFTDNTTVTVNGNDYVILAGSEATSVVVNATQLVVTIPTTKTFTLVTNSGLTLTNIDDAGTPVATTESCLGTVGTVAYTAVGTRVLTFTPTTLQTCGASQGGGSSGGSSSGDIVSPIAGSFLVNAGAATTSSLTVTLTLSATDNIAVTQMLISNNDGFAGASWENYATTKSWTLTSGDGVKTVYVKFKDAAGNVSVTTSDTITVSGSGTVVVPTPGPTEGCSGGNLYNPSTGKVCVNNVGNEHQTSSASNQHGPYDLGTKVLKNGSKGEAVKELQRLLNKVLNLGLKIDGKLGPKTIKVIKKWQKDHGLKDDGLIGAKTKAQMKAEAEKN